ncbi:hypothetical protein EV687_0912 [Corticibacter populi]|nr:hypothetical protein EV687_0912 [Corticibacter populi]
MTASLIFCCELLMCTFNFLDIYRLQIWPELSQQKECVDA